MPIYKIQYEKYCSDTNTLDTIVIANVRISDSKIDILVDKLNDDIRKWIVKYEEEDSEYKKAFNVIYEEEQVVANTIPNVVILEMPKWPSGLSERYITKEMSEERKSIKKENARRVEEYHKIYQEKSAPFKERYQKISAPKPFFIDNSFGFEIKIDFADIFNYKNDFNFIQYEELEIIDIERV